MLGANKAGKSSICNRLVGESELFPEQKSSCTFIPSELRFQLRSGMRRSRDQYLFGEMLLIQRSKCMDRFVERSVSLLSVTDAFVCDRRG